MINYRVVVPWIFFSVLVAFSLDGDNFFAKMMQSEPVVINSGGEDATDKDKDDTGGTVIEDEEEEKAWIKWVPTSKAQLKEAEESILSHLKTPYKGEYVNIGPVIRKGKKDLKLWTLSLSENNKNNNDSDKTPLLMIHGMGSGVALWVYNLDELAKDRTVYAFDMLGFGRSSRPQFSCDALEAESELVESIEEWRKAKKLERFVLLGHSMGGYVSTSYAIKYPDRVSHLILADPWGFVEKPENPTPKFNLPMWMKVMAFLTKSFNPLFALRFSGPWGGPNMIKKWRADLVGKFSQLHKDDEESKVADYIYHCNAQTPSAEAAFNNMSKDRIWAKNAMMKRLPNLDKDVPITAIYGSASFVDAVPGHVLREMRPESYVDVHTLEGVGHHVNVDDWKTFNMLVKRAAANGDRSNLMRFSENNIIAETGLNADIIEEPTSKSSME